MEEIKSWGAGFSALVKAALSAHSAWPKAKYQGYANTGRGEEQPSGVPEPTVPQPLGSSQAARPSQDQVEPSGSRGRLVLPLLGEWSTCHPSERPPLQGRTKVPLSKGVMIAPPRAGLRPRRQGPPGPDRAPRCCTRDRPQTRPGSPSSGTSGAAPLAAHCPLPQEVQPAVKSPAGLALLRKGQDLDRGLVGLAGVRGAKAGVQGEVTIGPAHPETRPCPRRPSDSG